MADDDGKKVKKKKRQTNKTILNKKGITKKQLKESIENLQGNISDVSKAFGYTVKNRGVIYRLIAKFDLIKELRLARGYEKRLEEITADLAVEINLEALLSMNPKKLQKQDVILLIFNLKSLAGFVEASDKKDIELDDNAVKDLIEVLKLKRENDNE